MGTYTNTDTIENENNNVFRYVLEILNTPIHGSALPYYFLSRKIVIIFMLLRKLDSKHAHVNGTLFVVEEILNNFLFLQIVTGMSKGANLTLPRISFDPGDDSLTVLGLKRLQSLVQGCFATTKNKGEEYPFEEKLGVDLHEDFIFLQSTLLGSVESHLVLKHCST